MNRSEAMEEALKAVLKCISLNKTCTVTMDCKHNIINYEKQIKAALALPRRQCDVGTAEEQARRYAQHCDTYLRDDGSKPCTGCSCCGKVPFGKCEFAWAQMPYESEAKG